MEVVSHPKMLRQSTKVKISYLYVPFGIDKNILQLQQVISWWKNELKLVSMEHSFNSSSKIVL